jgi:hypothetical protein
MPNSSSSTSEYSDDTEPAATDLDLSCDPELQALPDPAQFDDEPMPSDAVDPGDPDTVGELDPDQTIHLPTDTHTGLDTDTSDGTDIDIDTHTDTRTGTGTEGDAF